jgi:hypothetical protein
MSEIADNKWEASSAKPPVTTIPALAQILMMGGFALFFGWVLVFSLIGAFGPDKGGDLEERYKKMQAGDVEATVEKPAGNE